MPFDPYSLIKEILGARSIYHMPDGYEWIKGTRIYGNQEQVDNKICLTPIYIDEQSIDGIDITSIDFEADENEYYGLLLTSKQLVSYDKICFYNLHYYKCDVIAENSDSNYEVSFKRMIENNTGASINIDALIIISKPLTIGGQTGSLLLTYTEISPIVMNNGDIYLFDHKIYVPVLWRIA